MMDIGYCLIWFIGCLALIVIAGGLEHLYYVFVHTHEEKSRPAKPRVTTAARRGVTVYPDGREKTPYEKVSCCGLTVRYAHELRRR